MFSSFLLRPSLYAHNPIKINAINNVRCLSLKPRLPKLPKLPDFKIKQDPPGNITGTVNDAYVPPEFSMDKGSFHWVYERAIVVSLTPLVILPFIAGVDYPIIDSIFGSLILLHSRYGLQSCIIDYIPLRKFGFWHKLASFLLNIGTAVGLYGVYVLETEDNGVYNLVKTMWHA